MALTAGFKKFIGLVVVAAVVGGGIYGYKSGRFGKTDHATIASTSSGSSSSASNTPGNVSDDALTVSLVSFHGYAPALVANGNALTTQSGSIYDKLGLKLKVAIQDDIPTLTTIFESGAAQCAWRTSDFWAQEQPNLRNSKHDAKVVMVVDNTQGGDAIITKDPNIKTVEDLAGKTVALLQFTPSHGMTIDAIDNSSLSGKKKASIKYSFINADEGTSGVRAAYESGKVDAAVLWDPDLSLALKGGGHVVYSTKTATNLIYDVMVCDQHVLDDPKGRVAVKKFVSGWMQGVAAAKANPDQAVAALVKSEKMFELLQKQQGNDFIKGLFANLVWTGLDDNARIFGLVGGTNHYERVYKQFDQIYRTAGALANPNSPVINPQDSVDYSFIKELLSADTGAQKSAAQDKVVFTDTGRAAATTAAVTKPVTINFNSGSAELSQKSKQIIDTQMVPFIENNGSAYIELSGNTDSSGTAAVNKPLSQKRAKVVADYLVSQWEVNAKRLRVTGNGSDHPICSDATTEGVSAEECNAMNRATRVGILAVH